MAIKSDAAIYKIIEEHIKSSTEPLTCTTLWDFDDVKQHSRSAEKVSDFLGLMWRRGLLQRWSVSNTNTDRARYAYTWNETEETEPAPVENATARRPTVRITEHENGVSLDFDKFTIFIQPKN